MTPKEALEKIKENFIHNEYGESRGTTYDFGIECCETIEIALNELETLKCDIARYFELLNKLYYRGETFTDDNNVEFAKLTQKLSKVGIEK